MEISNIRSISEAELVNFCRAGQKSAWNEFFRRYTKIISNQIVKTLLTSYQFNLGKDDDVVREIYFRVVKKLYLKNSLQKIDNPNSIAAWLKTVARNTTLDWLKEYYSQKNLPKKLARLSLVSLSTPLNEDGNIVLQDTIAEENKTNLEAVKELSIVLKEIEKLREEELWALRLKVMFYNPLTDEEIIELSKFINKPFDKISEHLNNLMDRLLGKKIKKDADITLDNRAWSIIHVLETRLLESHNSANPSNQEKEKLEKDIKRKTKRMKILRHSGNQFIEPSNEDIADLIGIPRDKAQTISTLVHRARKKLKLIMEDRNSNRLLK
ncbi:MAG: hypothetical protein KJ550_03735 [Proteobacteria bacterium]|nr:hypothetical protein [Desulfobacteraceae bacterium]MBU4012557.1 hypothetical protein [Pseudomonadota bacterium]MBU4068325.1 hypothetical protein [Pseudomonadota bacterium]MBU4099982.1 hypothetical protein [Pseudomonadota bacterium]MBU4420513.1 hypothetical protein [Pseudomonadota bacterium]